MKKLSPQQKKVFDFIVQYHTENGISPSLAEIAKGLGLGATTICTYTVALKRKGYISSREHTARSFVILKKPISDVDGNTKKKGDKGEHSGGSH